MLDGQTQKKDCLPQIKHTVQVLLVSDDLFFQRTNHNLLRDLCCEAFVANNATAALDLVRKGYDFILLDIDSKNINSLELAPMLYISIERSSALIAVASHINIDIQKKYNEAGVKLLLSKPLDKKSLISLLQTKICLTQRL